MIFAGTAVAQNRVFDTDDSIDPRQHDGAVFMSRLIAGGASGFVDAYRPLHQNTAFLQLANSLYVGHFQFDFKHSDVFGKDTPVSVCLCNGNPIYFPTPPSPDSVPAAAPTGPKETAQFGWYHAVGGGRAQPPVMLRYRLTLSWQPIRTDMTSITTGETSHLSGRERSIGLDADTYFRIGGHDMWGSLIFARMVRTGTTDDRAQNEFAYTSRFPGLEIRKVLLRANLTFAGVSGRGASGLNIVNPAFEAFWHDPKTRMNLHLVWSPMAARSGAEGWQNFHQVAFFVDYAPYVKLFHRTAQ